MKRIFDFALALVGLILLFPFTVVVLLLIWLQDFKSPFYIAPRVGKGGILFNMVKLRSMVINADKTGVDSTSNSDLRITVVGRFIRKFKLDELSQIWNVLIGEMSFVGPRPNVKRETDLYTNVEKRLLTVRPGITDFSSIVFSDEGDILDGKEDPDIAYNQLIRPWKSRLGILYIDNMSLLLDAKLIFLTIVAVFSRRMALLCMQTILEQLNADEKLKKVCMRIEKLSPEPPPGSNTIVTTRSL